MPWVSSFALMLRHTLEPVHGGHHHVQKDEVHAVMAQQIEGVRAAGDREPRSHGAQGALPGGRG